METEDGYILAVIQIHSIKEKRKGVVFIQHTLLCGSEIWVDKGKNMSLALILIDQGYEVWLGSSRGTRLSQGHKYLTMSNTEFWDYR